MKRAAKNFRWPPIDDRERFERYFEPEPNSGCWLWTGAVFTTGYARFWFCDKPRNASRVAWTLYRGAIPDGMAACHKCDNPCCVNPDHLFLGTHAENMADMAQKGRGGSNAGARNGTTKLSVADVLSIRQSKESYRYLAKQYGISPTQACRIRLGRRWKFHSKIPSDGGQSPSHDCLPETSAGVASS